MMTDNMEEDALVIAHAESYIEHLKKENEDLKKEVRYQAYRADVLLERLTKISMLTTDIVKQDE